MLKKELFTNIKEETAEVVKKPADKIVDMIIELISSGQLKKGDKLPSERFFSEKFKVGRIFVRDAIRKLEFYGIVKIIPQSGTIITGNHDSAFMKVVANTLKVTRPDYRSLMETRYVLEIESARLAAMRAQPEDIELLEQALELLGKKVTEGKAAIEEDLLFHVRIAEASKNDVLKYMLTYLSSHMMNFSKEFNICRNNRNIKAYNEHVIIFEHIKNGDVEKAEESMKHHLSSLFDFIPKA
jgi:GntR family transcriptional repressor for pyruvate dehydrogenase complex